MHNWTFYPVPVQVSIQLFCVRGKGFSSSAAWGQPFWICPPRQYSLLRLLRAPQFDDHVVQRDGLLDVPPQQIGDLIHLLYRRDDPPRTHATGERRQLSAEIPVADVAARLAQNHQIAQQAVEHGEMKLELLILAPADGLRERHPRAEPAGARRRLQ